MFTVLFHPDTGHWEKKPQGLWLLPYHSVLFSSVIKTNIAMFYPSPTGKTAFFKALILLACFVWWLSPSVLNVLSQLLPSNPSFKGRSSQLTCVEWLFRWRHAQFVVWGIRLSLLVKWTVSGLWLPNSFFLRISCKKETTWWDCAHQHTCGLQVSL